MSAWFVMVGSREAGYLLRSLQPHSDCDRFAVVHEPESPTRFLHGRSGGPDHDLFAQTEESPSNKGDYPAKRQHPLS